MLIKVKSFKELQEVIDRKGVSVIEVEGAIICPYTIYLPYGVELRGDATGISMLSFNQSDGIGLQGNNRLMNLMIQVPATHRGIYINSSYEDVGTISLKELNVTGQVQLLTRENNMSGHIDVYNVDISYADTRKHPEHPQRYGMNVYQGAFTLYNYNSHPDSLITANIEKLMIGRIGAPSIGSGVFISGFGEHGGRVLVETLRTGAIYTNGMVPSGYSNLMTGAVFILSGATIQTIVHEEAVVTYGTNDMVLDVWGKVGHWVCEAPIVSYGVNGIGFVNYGEVTSFEAKDDIVTYGLGAIGFHHANGILHKGSVQTIETYGDGAVGVQVNQVIQTFIINEGIKTHGTYGQTLIKGLVEEVSADGMRILELGKIDYLEINGDIVTEGDGVTSLFMKRGQVTEFKREGDIVALGLNGIAINEKGYLS